MMERVNQIRKHPIYQQCYEEIQKLEQDREFCGHSMEHFIDVARLAYIFVLEEGLFVSREVVYAAALLHDIGRHLEYTQGVPHHEASAQIAAGILPECGFTKAEQDTVIGAILAHRNKHLREGFNRILYRADKMSRSCFSCKAASRCNWSDEKKNNEIGY